MRIVIKTAGLILILLCNGILLNAAIPSVERRALTALYKATGGDNWLKNSGWKEGTLELDGFGPTGSEGNWYGITIEGGHVTQISLSSNGLRGYIPRQLGNLSHLYSLYLNNSILRGNIPPELGKLGELRFLDLHLNHLKGNLPPELGNLVNLLTVNVSHNNLSGPIPPEFGNMKKMEYCLLTHNRLSGPIPPEFGKLAGLKSLVLAYNELCGSIPGGILNLVLLEYLHLDHNRLTGAIPPEIGNLIRLRGINFSNNRLTGVIPPEIGMLGELKYIRLEKNRLEGVIPPEIGKLKKLDQLILNENRLHGPLPISLMEMEKLRVFDFNYNALYTDNEELREFLYIFDLYKWLETQTVAPFGITGSDLSRFSVRLTWTPIWYNYGEGHYQVYYSQSGTGPWQLFGKTASKKESSMDVTGLQPGRLYYFKIRTESVESSDQPPLVSDFSRVVSGYTGAPAGEYSPPFGSFEMPVEGRVARGAIPVTGWALDDSGIRSVKIYRESSAGLVYIGDAFFVEGARPDVALAYPGYPGSDRAGWGYMLLTNLLPGWGNGTVKLRAIATDVAGKTTILGSKTIFCDNDHAEKPFGALDTPLPGEVVSGKSYVNFGWALTPLPNCIPVDGSTITVWVDGKPLGHPVYNRFRSDIADLFLGYVNSYGAAGYFYLDTTAYENGMHTLQWTVTDDAGNTDGIGSRYFTIQNPVSAQTAQAHEGFPGLFRSIPETSGSVRTRPVRQLERLKIDLREEVFEDRAFEPEGAAGFRGFQLLGRRILPLPVGSTLDKERGIFYWQPGLGFRGDFHLVFIKTGKSGKQTRRDLFVAITLWDSEQLPGPGNDN